MAIAVDAVGPSGGTGASHATNTPLSWTHVVGSGTDMLLLVGVMVGASSPDGSSVSSVTYGGTAMTACGAKVEANNQEGGYVQVFKLINPPTGSASVVVTLSATNIGNAITMEGGSISFSGADQTTGVGTPVTAFGDGSVPTASAVVTSNTSGNVIAAFGCCGSPFNSVTSPATSQFICNFQETSGAGCGAGLTIPATGSSVTTSWTITNDWWAVIAVEVLASTGPGPLQSTGNVANDVDSAAATFSTNLTAGTKLIAIATCYQATMMTVADGSGNNFTLLSAVGLNANTLLDGEMSVWAMDTPAGDVGTKPTITATATDPGGVAIVVQEVSGLLAGNTTAMTDGTPGVSFGSLGSNGNAATGSYSSFQAGEYLIAAYGDDEISTVTASTPTGSTSYTMDPNSQIANGIMTAAIAYGASTGGAESATFALTGVAGSDQWATALVAFPLAGSNPIYTVTATQTGDTFQGMVLRVLALTGAALAASQSGATVTAQPSTSPHYERTVTTTTTGSLVVGAMTDAFTADPAFVGDANTTMLDSVQDESNDCNYATWEAKALTGTPGATSFGANSGTERTGSAGAWAAAEILAAGSLADSGDGPASVSTETAITLTTASFAPPAGSLLVALVAGDNNDASVSMTITDSGGLTWHQLAFFAGASGGQSGVWVADVPSGSGGSPAGAIVAWVIA